MPGCDENLKEFGKFLAARLTDRTINPVRFVSFGFLLLVGFYRPLHKEGGDSPLDQRDLAFYQHLFERFPDIARAAFDDEDFVHEVESVCHWPDFEVFQLAGS